MRIVELGENGKGLKVREGDRLVIPSKWLKLSLNPLKSRGQFYKSGIEWFAKMIFLGDLPSMETDYAEQAKELEGMADRRLADAQFLQSLDVKDREDAEKIFELLRRHPQTPEYWAYWVGFFLATSRKAQREGDLIGACWATACAERCRSMLIFKDHLEEVVWMGNQVRRILEALRIWEKNKDSADERFWQATFNEHTYLLSQVFAVPVVFIKDSAYVGGMTVENKGGKLVDYLFSAESSRESLLVEIKTPVARLLGKKYRGSYAPSSDLTGSVIQVLDYRTELMVSLRQIASARSYRLDAFKPKCVLVVGNHQKELDTEDKRRSFELFRASTEVEIITYDELFRKADILAGLFGLTREGSSTAEQEPLVAGSLLH